MLQLHAVKPYFKRIRKMRGNMRNRLVKVESLIIDQTAPVDD